MITFVSVSCINLVIHKPFVQFAANKSCCFRGIEDHIHQVIHFLYTIIGNGCVVIKRGKCFAAGIMCIVIKIRSECCAVDPPAC